MLNIFPVIFGHFYPRDQQDLRSLNEGEEDATDSGGRRPRQATGTTCEDKSCLLQIATFAFLPYLTMCLQSQQ